MGTRLFMMTAIAVAMSAVATDLSWTGGVGAQVAMLRAETPDGRKTRLRITSAGYLVTPGTVVSVR